MIGSRYPERVMADELAKMFERFDYLFNPVSSQPSISPIADMPSYNHQSHLPPTPPECWPYYNGQHGPQFLNAQEFRVVEKAVDSYRGFSNSGPFQFETTPFQSRSESLFPPRQQANYHGIPPPGITHPNNNNHWYGAVALPPPSQKRVELPPIDGNSFERQAYQVCFLKRSLY